MARVIHLFDSDYATVDLPDFDRPELTAIKQDTLPSLLLSAAFMDTWVRPKTSFQSCRDEQPIRWSESSDIIVSLASSAELLRSKPACIRVGTSHNYLMCRWIPRSERFYLLKILGECSIILIILNSDSDGEHSLVLWCQGTIISFKKRAHTNVLLETSAEHSNETIQDVLIGTLYAHHNSLSSFGNWDSDCSMWYPYTSTWKTLPSLFRL